MNRFVVAGVVLVAAAAIFGVPTIRNVVVGVGIALAVAAAIYGIKKKREARKKRDLGVGAAVALAAVGIGIAGAVYGFGSSSSSSSESSEPRKTMKAPGKKGEIIYRDDFLRDTPGYFRGLRNEET